MLTRYRFPMAPLNDLRHEMERLLDNFGARELRSWFGEAGVYPALNIWDAGEALCVEAEVPGVSQGDLDVFAAGNELTIKGRRVPVEGESRTYHRQERGLGEFCRVVTLPAEVDADRVEATLKDGVLSLRLPKAESAKPRKIALKTE